MNNFIIYVLFQVNERIMIYFQPLLHGHECLHISQLL